MKRIYLGIVLLALSFASCKDFLEPTSQSRYSPTEIRQLNELVLNALPGHGVSMSNFLDLVTDDVSIAGYFAYPNPPGPNSTWYDNGNAWAIYAVHTWQPNYWQILKERNYNNNTDLYSSLQTKLVTANATLDYIDDVSGTQQEKDWVEAQALALRGFMYLHLVNVYGVPYTSDPNGPGVPVRVTAEYDEEVIARSTVAKVYERIEADLLRAEALFRTQPEVNQYRPHRPTLPMTMHLLSRMYLYMGNWEKAAEYADKLIREWPQFSPLNLNDLIAAGKTNTKPNPQNRQEKRTQKFYDFISYDNRDVIWLFGSADDMTTLLTYQLSTPTVNVSNPFMVSASADLVGSYEPGDLRIQTYFLRDLYSEAAHSNSPGPIVYNRFRPFGKVNIQDKGGYPSADLCKPSTGPLHQGQALRITETYMILAEAKAMLYKEKGDGAAFQAAVDALNKVRENRFATYTPKTTGDFASADDLVRFVRDERRREFCFEALRWFDLRRWGMPELTHTWYVMTGGDAGTQEKYVLQQGDPGYTFPMPDDVINANNAMTQVPTYNNKQGRNPVP